MLRVQGWQHTVLSDLQGKLDARASKVQESYHRDSQKREQ